jgi:hypothetical protein
MQAVGPDPETAHGIHAGSPAFGLPEGTADPGLRVWDDEATTAREWGVWSRPDAHTVQYRLYCQVRGNVFTDGVLHQFEVPADEDVRRPGSGG